MSPRPNSCSLNGGSLLYSFSFTLSRAPQRPSARHINADLACDTQPDRPLHMDIHMYMCMVHGHQSAVHRSANSAPTASLRLLSRASGAQRHYSCILLLTCHCPHSRAQERLDLCFGRLTAAASARTGSHTRCYLSIVFLREREKGGFPKK